DWMPRNLDHRIEVMAPVYNPAVRAELKRIVEWGMMDNRKGRIVDGTGHNMFYEGTEGAEAFRSQERLYDYYAKQVTEKQNDKSNE
ncbi:MAG TPA: RNA degradosome polyphosphate kinase, partial [Paraprevotella xylaniphila]|nr:RNA degradosome polyphosphate kinase [Paraprevotella xylaniphila]